MRLLNPITNSPKALTAPRTRDHFAASQLLLGTGHRPIATADPLLAASLLVRPRHGRRLLLLGEIRLLLLLRWLLLLLGRMFLGCGLFATLAGIGVLFESLELGQRNDVALARPVPDGLLRGRIVVVEPLGIRIEQFPPLR